jgi:hypothetical protein
MLHGRKKLPIGKVIRVTPEYGQPLIDEGVAFKYLGKLPPDKMKTEFFKPKEDIAKWQH